MRQDFLRTFDLAFGDDALIAEVTSFGTRTTHFRLLLGHSVGWRGTDPSGSSFEQVGSVDVRLRGDGGGYVAVRIGKLGPSLAFPVMPGLVVILAPFQFLRPIGHDTGTKVEQTEPT